MAIFPWFSDSVIYKAAFPNLFVVPYFKTKSEIATYEGIVRDPYRNIMLIGSAGAGKSTLLRNVFLALYSKGSMCLYVTADEIVKNKRLLDETKQLSGKQKVLFLIDGIDETFHQNYEGYKQFLIELKSYVNCVYWLGCRTDFYRMYYSDNVNLGGYTYEIEEWKSSQINQFIDGYAQLVDLKDLHQRIDFLLGSDVSIVGMKENPFQLAVIAFLAAGGNQTKLYGVYDLYERFLEKWLEHEQLRGTSNLDEVTVINALSIIAAELYVGKEYMLTQDQIHCSAIRNLLFTEKRNIGRLYATSFYHRSIAAFLLAYNVIQAIEKEEFPKLKSILSSKLKDDVTNFIGSRFSALTGVEKERYKTCLERLYKYCSSTDAEISVQEQIVYLITRLDIDVSDFLYSVIESNPKNLIMRLTLAYGSVLSNDQGIRKYALSYAKSIAAETEDALTNRGWTVVYFGDVNDRNPYVYKDDECRPWKKAREARIKRFTKSNPRIKDIRFWLFDIPLFYSFLKSRNWNDITEHELQIIESLNISEHYFFKDEVDFLIEVRNELVQKYREMLNQLKN